MPDRPEVDDVPYAIALAYNRCAEVAKAALARAGSENADSA